MNTKRVQYQPGLYANPYQKDESTVSAIKQSFSGSRDTHARLLKKRHLEEQSQEEAPNRKRKPGELPKAAPRPNVLPESPRLA